MHLKSTSTSSYLHFLHTQTIFLLLSFSFHSKISKIYFKIYKLTGVTQIHVFLVKNERITFIKMLCVLGEAKHDFSKSILVNARLVFQLTIFFVYRRRLLLKNFR